MVERRFVDQLPNLPQANVSTNDLLAILDVSANVMKNVEVLALVAQVTGQALQSISQLTGDKSITGDLGRFAESHCARQRNNRG